MSRRQLWILLALSVLTASTVLLYREHPWRDDSPILQIPCANVVAGCQLSGQGARVIFDQRPQPMQPFRLRVEVLNAHEVHASFAMQGMQMGLNRYRLLPGEVGVWTALIILPVCVQGRSDWVMTLNLDGQRYGLPFVAESTR